MTACKLGLRLLQALYCKVSGGSCTVTELATILVNPVDAAIAAIPAHFSNKTGTSRVRPKLGNKQTGR